MTVDELNRMANDVAVEHFLRCCGSSQWAKRMAESRPYANQSAVLDTADRVWRKLPHTDWLEAFTAHPRIGDVNSLRKKFENTKAWASGEQSGVDFAAESVLQGLADGNRKYEEKNGFIFIVCATGKSAAEMLALLKARLPNSREQEIQNAADEQMKITRIRIDKWLDK